MQNSFNELAIKEVLHTEFLTKLCQNNPGTKLIEELSLLDGKVRIDIAAINGQLHGFEIKSAVDNLSRLANQQDCYNKIFDKITIIAHEKHVSEAVQIISPNWGLIAASKVGQNIILNEIWPARQNLNQDPLAIAQLLWKEEAINILRFRGFGYGITKYSRKYLWRILAEKIDLETLKTDVRRCLRYRTNWR